jgi:esterase/lipase
MEIKTLANGKTKVVLDKGVEESNTAVIFIPGVSGKAFSDKYKYLSDGCLAKGIYFLRVQSWDNVEELEQKNIKQIQEDIDQAIRFLKSKGYTKIFAIGKSLGGGILLTRNYPKITKMVLWAPAIGVADSKGNLDDKIDVVFSEINSLLEVTVDKDLLSNIKVPVKIIQGTDDKNVPMENSLKIASVLPHSSVIKIKDMGHSAETPEQEKELIDDTINFLSPSPSSYLRSK